MNSGAMREADMEELEDIIPIEVFNIIPVEPYKPHYAPEWLCAMLTKGKWLN
jgi:hypothetical protein